MSLSYSRYPKRLCPRPRSEPVRFHSKWLTQNPPYPPLILLLSISSIPVPPSLPLASLMNSKSRIPLSSSSNRFFSFSSQDNLFRLFCALAFLLLEQYHEKWASSRTYWMSPLFINFCFYRLSSFRSSLITSKQKLFYAPCPVLFITAHTYIHT